MAWIYPEIEIEVFIGAGPAKCKVRKVLREKGPKTRRPRASCVLTEMGAIVLNRIKSHLSISEY